MGKKKDIPLSADLYRNLNKVNRIMCALTNGHFYTNISPEGMMTVGSDGLDISVVMDFFGLEEMEKKDGERTKLTKEKCEAFNDFFVKVGRGIRAEWDSEEDGVPIKFDSDFDEKIFTQFMADILGMKIERENLLWDSPSEVHLGELAWVTGYIPKTI